MSISPVDLPRVQNDYHSSRTRPAQVWRSDLWQMLEDPALSQGYRHLTLTLLANGPDCDHVRQNMDAYVLSELKGETVHRTFPEQWLHLQACSKCREFHDLLHFLTRETLPIDDGWGTVQVTAFPV